MQPLNSIEIVLTVALTLLSLFCFFRWKRNSAVFHEQRLTISKLKMEAIRIRMSPHFLFNALSALSGLTNEPETLREKINVLLSMLRKSVDNMEKMVVPLYEELELVKNYVDLQCLKVPEPFIVSYEVEPGLNMNHPIPAMILQIPVENAIKHGLMPLAGDKLLRIKIYHYSKGIHISVEDNGVGYRTSAHRSMSSGTGLKILYQIIASLNSQNDSKIEFSILEKEPKNAVSGGTIVEIKIPEKYSYDI